MTQRQWVTGAVVGVLALVTTLLVVLALRPATRPAATTTPLEMGAVAANGDTVWRWVGPTSCNADADVVQLERSQGGGDWTPSAIPLANVYSLSFSTPTKGIATGTTSQCSRGVALTRDGGRTWKSRDDNPALLDAWYVDGTVWGIERVIGQPQLAAYRVDSRLRLRPIGGIEPIQPCDAADGVPQQVAFWSESTGVLLCQNSVIGSRLLARTTNSGTNFERLTDDRPSLGLDGVEPITDLDVVGNETVFALFEGGSDCREGQLRVSDSQGALFESLPCASDSVDVDRVIDVAFTSERDGVLLGVSDRAAVMLVTDDGGATWSVR